MNEKSNEKKFLNFPLFLSLKSTFAIKCKLDHLGELNISFIFDFGIFISYKGMVQSTGGNYFYC